MIAPERMDSKSNTHKHTNQMQFLVVYIDAFVDFKLKKEEKKNRVHAQVYQGAF